MKVKSSDEKTITLADGRTFPRPQGTKTILPTGERVYYNKYHFDRYMGDEWEFTGKIRYENNPDWVETYVYFEIIRVWETDHWLIPFITVTRAETEWLTGNEVKYDFATKVTFVDCE